MQNLAPSLLMRFRPRHVRPHPRYCTASKTVVSSPDTKGVSQGDARGLTKKSKFIIFRLFIKSSYAKAYNRRKHKRESKLLTIDKGIILNIARFCILHNCKWVNYLQGRIFLSNSFTYYFVKRYIERKSKYVSR